MLFWERRHLKVVEFYLEVILGGGRAIGWVCMCVHGIVVVLFVLLPPLFKVPIAMPAWFSEPSINWLLWRLSSRPFANFHRVKCRALYI